MFEVGDRVVRICGQNQGELGTIIKCYKVGNVDKIVVRWDNNIDNDPTKERWTSNVRDNYWGMYDNMPDYDFD